MKELSNDGHCFAGYEQLVSAAVILLSVERKHICSAIDALVAEERLIEEQGEIFLPKYYYAEIGVANRLRRMMKGGGDVLEGFDVEEIETEGSGEWVKVEDGYVCAEYVQDDNPVEGEFLGVWRVTAYAATGNACANGNYPSVGTTIAHNSLPFGTRVYIEGVGERVVEDRGPAYLGEEWCDLYLGDTASCIQWGDQQRRVWRIVG